MSGTAQQVVKDVKESLANDFCAKGFQLYKGNSFSNALSCFCRGVQMDHQCAKAYAGLGLVYEKLRPDDQVLAETYFTQCRNLDSDGQVARDFVQDGRNVLEAEDPEGALAWLGPAIGVGPQVAEAYLWRGVAHLQMTNTDRGNEDLARAKDYGVSIGMSEDLQEEALRLRSSKPPKLGLALSCLTASIFLNPGAGAYNLRNTCYYRRGDWDRAIADCDSAIALAPSNAIYFCNRAAAYLAKGETNAALADYNRSIAVEPGNEWGWESRGNYYSRRQPTNALADYTEAIRISPNKVNLYNERGTAHFWKQDWDLAIADYSTFLSRVATDATVLDNRGAAYASKGETNQALADFNNAIELEPRNADTRKMRGDFYVGLKDYVRAVGDYSAAIDLQPTNAALYTVRGKAYLEEGDWPQAIINFNEAISRDTNNPDAYFWRAITYRNQREWAKALRDFDHRIAMSTNANDLVQRGRIYRAVGDSEKARADFSKAEALCDPAHDLVTLAFARAFQGRFAEALADFQRAIAAAPNDPEQLVYLARFYAIRAGSHAKGKKEERASRGDVESALLTLERLFRDKGYKTWSRSMAAMDFEILQNEPRFRAITRPP
jgi:tetratricopeptide (TPR) repeat protein